LSRKTREEALTALILEEKEHFYRLAYSYVKNQQDALDVVQDSIHKALRAVHRLDDASNMRNWYIRIVINTAIDRLRKQKRELLQVEDGGNSAHIEVPSLEDMNNTELQASLNEKYAAESKALYEQFLTETKLQDVKGGHFSIDSGYEIKTNNEQILSLARYVVETAGSSAESYHIDTIDKQNEWLITLPSLFKHDDYIAVISDNIKQRMISRMEQDESLIYWIEQADDEAMTDAFQHISADQTFYINDQQQLVIVFNEYEVAPGYMGIVEFTIPSEVLADVLVSDAYIK